MVHLALLGFLLLASMSARGQGQTVHVDVDAELQCTAPSLDDAGTVFAVGFLVVTAPVVIAWGGAILIRAIRSISQER